MSNRDIGFIKNERRKFEERWKKTFATRLQKLIEERGIPLTTVAETVECDEERISILLRGEDFPTVIELLRLCYLSYDADNVLFGVMERGLYDFLRG